MAHRPDETQDDAQWRTAGDRIQTLLDASAAGGTVARERAEQLVREVTDLYGAGLERMLRIATAADPDLADRLAADDLVASLLLVHGLHPHDVERRVSDALDTVRPYLGSHGGDVSLIEVAGRCGATAVHRQLQKLPVIGGHAGTGGRGRGTGRRPGDRIDRSGCRRTAVEYRHDSGGVAAEPRARPGHGASAWHPAPDLADLAPGEVGGFRVAGTTVLACRVGDDLFAYHDRCGGLRRLAGGRRAAPPDGAARRCCDARAATHTSTSSTPARASTETARRQPHLEPIPLLERDGVLSVAVVADEVSP